MSEQQQTMRDRLRLPDAPPPRLDHVVVTGALAEEPRLGRNPIGEPVTLLRVGFPVADPMRPQTLLTWATVEVEVPDPLADRQDGLAVELDRLRELPGRPADVAEVVQGASASTVGSASAIGRTYSH